VQEVPPGVTKGGRRGWVTSWGRRETVGCPLSLQQMGKEHMAAQGTCQPLGVLGVALV